MFRFQIDAYLIHWYFSFLVNRVKLVKVNDALSSPNTTNIREPQGTIYQPPCAVYLVPFRLHQQCANSISFKIL